MSIKYKIGLTITAETLFGMMAKFLPIEDLYVEEILPQPTRVEPIEKISDASPKIKIKPGQNKDKQFKHPSGKTLTYFILEYFKQRPKHIASWFELSKYTVEIGYNKASINNSITRLINSNQIEKISRGEYRLIENKTQKSA
jgi:hypothetical protein